jgi:Uma2 family endonuclease
MKSDSMPASLTERPSPPVPQNPPRKRWTRAECQALEAAGIFDQQRVELVEGELIDKMGKDRPHVDALALLFTWLIHVFGSRLVNSEAPIDVAPEDNPTNEPQPDLIVLKREYSGFRSVTPQPKDLDLVVEIADSSLAFDLTVKAALYARAGIADYWVLDLLGRRLIVHRNPQGGRYASVTSYDENESVTPLSAPNSPFPVREVFPEG